MKPSFESNGRRARLLSTCTLAAFSTIVFAGAVQAAEEQAQTLRKVEVSADEPDTTAGTYTTQESSSATRLPLTLRETPQSVTIMTRQRLDDQKMTSVRDVLDNTGGIYSYAWDTERVLFTARGFDVDNLMYDGVPAVTNFSTGSVDETIDTAVYDRIEIVRGATGLMTGSGSPAASINLVRKRADSRELTGDLNLTMARWNDRRVDADVSTPLNSSGSVRARIVGVYQDRESYQDLYRSKREVFYGVVDADLSEDTLLSVGVDYQNNRPTGNTWGSFPLFLSDGSLANWPRSVTTATDWSFWTRRTKSAFAEVRHSFANDWSLRASLTWRRFNEDLALFYMYGFPDVDTGEGLEPYAYRSQAQITQKSLDVYATGPVSLFGREHELVVGFNGSKSQNDGQEFAVGELAPPGNFFEWDGSYPKPDFDTQGVLLNDIDSRENGLYVAGRFVLADPLKLIAGLRYATWDTDHFYLYDSPDVTFHDSYEKIIPYGAFVYDFGSHYSAFISYTEIFKPQNARDINGSYLDPIDGRSIEGGIRGEYFDGRFNTSLTLFQTDQDNVAAAATDPETGEPILLPDGTQASYPIDGARTRGFEIEASGALSQDWNASLGWTYHQIEDADGNDVRTFVPRTLVRAFTTWTPSATLPDLTIGGGVNWQSASHTIVGAPDGAVTFKQESVALVNLMVRYAFTPSVSVQINGDNLLDEKYFVLDEYDNTYYGEPIKYSASLQWTF